MIKSAATLIGSLMAVLLLGGCATPQYDFVSAQPSQQTATIRTSSHGLSGGTVSIWTINSKPTRSTLNKVLQPDYGVEILYVYPGQYTLELHAVKMAGLTVYKAFGTVSLVAEAAHTYKIEHEDKGGVESIEFSVIDESTGMPVGEAKDSGNEPTPENTADKTPVETPEPIRGGPSTLNSNRDNLTPSNQPASVPPLTAGNSAGNMSTSPNDSDYSATKKQAAALKQLKDEGLLTDEEYDAKLKALLDRQ